MVSLSELINYWLPLVFKLIKICLYFSAMIWFIKKAHKKEDSAKFEILISLFFMFMGIGSLLEVITQNYYPEFYSGVVYLLWPAISAEALVYFFGFVAIGLLTLGTEINVKLKTHGILSIIPFALAVATLYFGILITEYIYLSALIIVIIPILYFYIAFKAPKGLKEKSFCVAIGYFLVFFGEAANYSIMMRVEPLKSFFTNVEVLFGYKIAFIQPLIIIIGLFFLFYGYKTK
ncbi:MAG: hypothetical protein ACTSUG_02515 [Candidatus Helarchaeota archaeon]